MIISDYDHVQVNYDMHNLRDENVQIHFDMVVSEQTMIKLQLLNADYQRRKFFSIMRSLSKKQITSIQQYIQPYYMLEYDYTYATDLEFIITMKKFKEIVDDPNCALTPYIDERQMGIINVASANINSQKMVYRYHKERMNKWLNDLDDEFDDIICN